IVLSLAFTNSFLNYSLSKRMTEMNKPIAPATPSTSNPGDLAHTKEEIGFAEFPIVITSRKRPNVNTFEFTEVIGYDEHGQPLHRTWQIVGSQEYGPPRDADLDVLVGILKILERHAYRNRIVPCTAKDICTIAGLARGG